MTRSARPPASRPVRFIDRLNEWLIALQAVAVIVGVIVALYQLHEISAQTRLQSQSLKITQATQSATLILTLRTAVDAEKYKKITAAIQGHDQKFKLLGAGFSGTDVERYIGNFEDIGLLIKESPLLGDMAYDHFGYDIEKAWCNQDVQKVVADSRKVDRSVIASSDPIYGQFETLARSYLDREKQTCADMDKQ
jgi:hypothetical protein